MLTIWMMCMYDVCVNTTPQALPSYTQWWPGCSDPAAATLSENEGQRCTAPRLLCCAATICTLHSRRWVRTYSVYMYMLYVHNYPAHLCTRVMWCVCAQAMNFCSRSSSLLQKHLYSLFLVCPSLEDETCNTSVHFTSSLYTPLQLWLSLLPSTSLLPSLLINLTFLYSSFKCVCELVCQYYYTWC